MTINKPNLNTEEILTKFANWRDTLKAKYQALEETWSKNGHFTFFFVPGNGHNPAKKHFTREQIKIAGICALGAVVFLTGTIGVLGHYAYKNETERRELAEFKRTKETHAKQIAELEAVAKQNQQKLAELNKLEEQVRAQLEKNGTALPPKNDPKVNAKGGPSDVPISRMDVLSVQESNINKEAQAREKNLGQLLATINLEIRRKEAAPSFYPLDGGIQTSGFGNRRNPFNSSRAERHPGIDISMPHGSPIYAGGSGTVEHADWYYGYGNYIKIAHDMGFETAYGHLSEIIVEKGQQVEKGQLIGYVGSTGYSTGPHLHYEVILNGIQVDPAKYWKK